MNIYFCRESGQDGGRFVSAPSRAKAREVFSEEMCCYYTDVRVRTVRSGVTARTKIIGKYDPDLKRFGLGYK